MKKFHLVSPKWASKHNRWEVLGLLLLAAIVMTVLELTDTTFIFHRRPIPPVISVTSTPSSANNSTVNNENSASSDKSNTPANSSGQSNLPLYAPYGDFISNHHPNLSGSPAPSQETSVCNTTPGASCYISFTKGSLSTKLPAQTADSKGTVYWTWDVKKSGLTSGDWRVTAVASLNGKTKTTNDPFALSVSQ